MSYWDIAEMANDNDLLLRETACAAQEVAGDPYVWAGEHRLDLAAQPGWSEAWASARVAAKPNPGKDEGVITDGMILAATQALNAGGE